jgi:hypothetical protein
MEVSVTRFFYCVFILVYRSLPEEQRQPFIAEANRLREQHKCDYPEYRYQPKRKVKSMFKEISFSFSNFLLRYTLSSLFK